MQKTKEVVTVARQMDEYKQQLEDEKKYKPKVFYYPEWDQPMAVFDFEDLENEDSMLILCVRKQAGNPN